MTSNLTWKKIPSECSRESNHEEFETSNFARPSVFLGVKGIQECRQNQIIRPNHRRRLDLSNGPGGLET